MRKALKDLLAGIVFVGFGLGFALGATSYSIGTPVRMGPGFLPLALGIILVGLGILIIVKGYIAGEGDEIGEISWRAVILITGSIIVFGIVVRPFGLLVALLSALLLAAFAHRRSGIVAPLVTAAGLTALCIVIFVFALQLRLPLFGPNLPFP